MTISPQHGDLRLTGPNLRFFVVGGRYADTSFTVLIEADETESPFETYDNALEAWRVSSMRHIDEAFARYLIVQADSLEAVTKQAEEPPPQATARSA